MGKGNRNRENNAQGRVAVAAKKRKKPVSDWLPSVIAIVVVVAILAGVVFSLMLDNGIFMRNRTLVKSKTGKFDVNQQMATYMAWQSEYNWATQVYYYASQGYNIENEDSNAKIKIASYLSSNGQFDQTKCEQYALMRAWEKVTNNLRDSVDSNMSSVLTYVAVADAAYEAGIRLDKTDKADFNQTAENFLDIRDGFRQALYSMGIDISMDIKKGDIKDALELMTMYTKYGTMMQAEFEGAVTSADREGYRDANPENFYKIDYLTYTGVLTEEEAKAIAGATDPATFKSLVAKNYLETNYKSFFNKLLANDLLGKLGDATDNENGTALTDKMNENVFEAEATMKKDGTTDAEKDLSTWLFTTGRKQFDKGMVKGKDGCYYVVVYLSDTPVTTATTEVKARYKLINEAGDVVGEDANFKSNIITYVAQSKLDNPVYPEVAYQTAYDQAVAFLSAQSGKSAADIKAAIEAVTGSASVKNVTSSSPETTIPSIVRDAALASTTEKGKAYVVPVAGEDMTNYDKITSHYVYVVTDETDGTYITYAEFKGERYYELIDDLRDGLNAIYPEDSKTASYKANATAGSYEAWLSEVKEGSFISARTENEANYFKKETTSNGTTTTTWDVYMVVKNEKATASMLYLDTDIMVSGGYYLYDKEAHATEAQKALETIGQKTEIELLNAMSAVNENAVTSTTIAFDESDVEESKKMDANLKAWLFSDERTPNSVATIANAEGTGTYVAVFVEKATAWEISAKSGFVSEKMEKWMKDLSAGYAVRDKALAKLGEPTTTAAAAQA